jgi:single-strand DNA-binding protein
MSLNKVILIGYVGKDPDVRYFDSGNVLANFSVATSERGYKLANGIEVPERTEWHNIVTRDRAQFVEKYVKKGSFLYIEGKIRSRNYDDKDGNKRYITEIYADRVEFAPFGGGNRDSSSQNSSRGETSPKDESSSGDIPAASPDIIDDLPF